MLFVWDTGHGNEQRACFAGRILQDEVIQSTVLNLCCILTSGLGFFLKQVVIHGHRLLQFGH